MSRNSGRYLYCELCCSLYERRRVGCPCDGARQRRKQERELKQQAEKVVKSSGGSASALPVEKKFGLPPGGYKKMREAQGDMCAICGGKNYRGRRLVVDQDQVSGKIRALLCGHCNAGLGMLQDSPELCQRAAEYVERHRVEGVEYPNFKPRGS